MGFRIRETLNGERSVKGEVEPLLKPAFGNAK